MDRYFVNSSVCVRCDDKCYTCTSNASYCVMPCPANCTSCTLNTTDPTNTSNLYCLSCEMDFELTIYGPRLCREICGDYIADVTPCDNGPDVPFDGCDADCNV